MSAMNSAIVARLGLDSGEFRKDLRAVAKAHEAEQKKMVADAKQAAHARTAAQAESIAQIRGAAGELAGALGLSVGIGSLVSAGKAAIDFASNLKDSSEALGVNVEVLQELNHAFGQSGSNAETTAKGIKSLSESLTQAKGGNEKLIETFADLGVTWEQINTLTPDEVIMRIAASSTEAHDPAKRLNDIIDVMGRSGFKMAAGLNGGAEALRNLRKEAAKLSAEETDILDRAGDTISGIQQKGAVIGAKALLGILDPIGQAARAAQKNTPVIAKARDTGEVFGPQNETIPASPAELKATQEFYDGLEKQAKAEDSYRELERQQNNAFRSEQAKAEESYRETERQQVSDFLKFKSDANDKADKESRDRGEALNDHMAGLADDFRKDQAAKQAKADADAAAAKEAFIDNALAGPDARREAKREQQARERLGRRHDREEDLEKRKGRAKADVDRDARLNRAREVKEALPGKDQQKDKGLTPETVTAGVDKSTMAADIGQILAKYGKVLP